MRRLWFYFLTFYIVLPFTAFTKLYVLIVGLEYKPQLKPFIAKELNLIKNHLGNYTVLTPEKFKNVVFSKNDTLIVLGEYYGFKLYPKGKLKWLILDYCLSCKSIDLEKVKASHILCAESQLPSYGFYYLYTVKTFSPEQIKKALLKTFKHFHYRGELGKIKIRLFNKNHRRNKDLHR